MEKIQQTYLANLRKMMAEQDIHTVIISGTDPHQSELPPAHWRSAGPTPVISSRLPNSSKAPASR